MYSAHGLLISKDSILITPERFQTIFIVIKGTVFEYSPDNVVVMDYQNEDSFDSNS